MFGNRDIPTYLFTGFLESGKTTCIKEILKGKRRSMKIF